MLRDLFAVVVLLLAMSPFTAPFQACGTHASAVAAIAHDDDPGSLVPPLVPKAALVFLAPPATIRVHQEGLCTPLVLVGPMASGFPRLSLRPTILRI